MDIFKEKVWPFALSTEIVIALVICKIDFVYSKALDTALTGIITIAALVVGFFGTILTVIIGIKNESKFARYVFERDKNKLFLKYIRSTLWLGILLMAFSVILYFAGDYTIKYADKVLFYADAWLLISFLACTYRSMNHMLKLVFSTDADLTDNGQSDLLSRSSSEAAEAMRKDLLEKQKEENN